MKNIEFLKNGILVLGVRATGAGLTFLSTLVFAHLLGVKEFGIFSLSLTIITIVAVFVRMGLDNIVLKQVAVYLPEKPDISNGYVYSSISWVLIFGSVLSVLIWLKADYISQVIFEKPLLEQSLKFFGLAIIPLSLVALMSASFKSFGKPIYSTLVQAVIAPLLTLIIIFILWLLEAISLERIIFAVFVGFVFSFLVFFISWRKNYKHLNISKQPFRKLIREGYPMLLISSGALVMAWSDIVILGIFSSSSDIGIYSAASRTVMVTSLVLIAINSITAPKYARFYRENNIEAIEDLAKLSSLVLLVTVSVPIGIFFFYSEFVMGLFGKNYIIGADILIILAVGQLVNVAFGSVGYLLTMTGKEHTHRNIMFISAIINVLLSVVAVKYYGYIGVAYATAFSTILWNTLALIEVKKHLGFWTINPNILNKKFKGI